MAQTGRINAGAVIAGVTSFLILYVLLALGLVFALSLFSGFMDADWIEHLFKLFGALALLFPGYAAARIAGRNGLLHGLLTGVGASVVSALFMMLTFSWEGTYPQAVWLAIARITAFGLILGSLGGLLGEWRNRKHTQADRLHTA